MKKIFLLMGCLALIMAGCKKEQKKVENEAQETVEAAADAAESAATAAVEAVNNFLQENSIAAKSFGLHEEADGGWTLNLKDTDANGETTGDLKKIFLTNDAQVILIKDGAFDTIPFANIEKSILNNKKVSYWLDDAKEKITHIVEIAE
jgi:hypothetical protein